MVVAGMTGWLGWWSGGERKVGRRRKGKGNCIFLNAKNGLKLIFTIFFHFHIF